MYLVRASDIPICIRSTYHTHMYAETARTEKASQYNGVIMTLIVPVSLMKTVVYLTFEFRVYDYDA